MVGRVIGVVDAHSTSNSSNLGSSVSHHTESTTWGEDIADLSVLDTVKQ